MSPCHRFTDVADFLGSSRESVGGPRGCRAPWSGWDQGKHQHNSLRSAGATLGTYMMFSLIPTRPGGRKRCGFSRKNQVPLAPRRDRRSLPERRAPPGQREIRAFFWGLRRAPKPLGGEFSRAFKRRWDLTPRNNREVCPPRKPQKAMKTSLFHALGALPEPKMTHRFCRRGHFSIELLSGPLEARLYFSVELLSGLPKVRLYGAVSFLGRLFQGASQSALEIASAFAILRHGFTQAVDTVDEGLQWIRFHL